MLEYEYDSNTILEDTMEAMDSSRSFILSIRGIRSRIALLSIPIWERQINYSKDEATLYIKLKYILSFCLLAFPIMLLNMSFWGIISYAYSKDMAIEYKDEDGNLYISFTPPSEG